LHAPLHSGGRHESASRMTVETCARVVDNEQGMKRDVTANPKSLLGRGIPSLAPAEPSKGGRSYGRSRWAASPFMELRRPRVTTAQCSPWRWMKTYLTRANGPRPKANRSRPNSTLRSSMCATISCVSITTLTDSTWLQPEGYKTPLNLGLDVPRCPPRRVHA
jgi:hypothetical protein